MTKWTATILITLFLIILGMHGFTEVALAARRTIDIHNLADWDSVGFSDPNTDAQGNSIDVTRLYIANDENYLYVRWDAKLPANASRIAQTAFGLAFDSKFSGTGIPLRDVMLWVEFDSKGAVANMTLAKDSGNTTHRIWPTSPATDVANYVARFGEGSNGASVSLVIKIPFSAFAALGVGTINADSVFPLWSVRLASGSWTSNPQDRTPDEPDSYFDWSGPDGSGEAVGSTYSNEKRITSFIFAGLSPSVTGVINEDLKTIRAKVPPGTNLASLIPTISHTGVRIEPSSGVAQDFTGPVSYTVTAEDGTRAIYTVYVTFSGPGFSDSSLTVDKAVALRGDILTYTIQLSNTTDGPLPLTVTNNLPQYLAYVPGSFIVDGVPREDLAGFPLAHDGLEVSVPISGSTISFQAQVDRVDEEDEPLDHGTMLVNRTHITDGIYDLELFAETIVKVPVVEVTKTGSATEDMVLPGDEVTFTTLVRNIGEVDVINVSLTDIVPEWTVYLSAAGPEDAYQEYLGADGVWYEAATNLEVKAVRWSGISLSVPVPEDEEQPLEFILTVEVK